MKKVLVLIGAFLLILALVLSTLLTACGPSASPAPATSAAPAPGTSQPAAPQTQAAAPKSIELTFAHMFPPQSPEGQVADKWGAKIKEDSKGLLTVRVFPVGTLIAAPEISNGVLKGAADIGMGFPYVPEGFELSSSMPFILTAPTIDIATKVYNDLWKQFPDAMANEWKNYKVLWMTPAALQTLWTAERKFQTLDDMKGLQLRVPSKEMGSVITALGSTPTFMSVADLVVALDKGTVDGCINMHTAIQSNKLTSLKYALKLPGMSCGVATPLFAIMNKDSYAKLSPDLQKVIDNSLDWAGQLQIDTWTANQTNAEKWFTDQGGEFITISAEEEAKFAAIYGQSKTQAAQALDARGLPASAITQYIDERIQFYLK
ncbi:MAG: TRAP transporter substrate-binding protein DctP [Dehalococcoidales bacterium]|nr:TRAP transporter substrate-binding protein DctP [Dehalococcoidales bacterium]